MRKNNSSNLYLSGIVILLLAIIIFLLGITLPLINQNIPALGWIGVILAVVGFVLSFFAIFLLKKANYVKLNEKLKDKNDDKK